MRELQSKIGLSGSFYETLCTEAALNVFFKVLAGSVHVVASLTFKEKVL